MIKNQEIVLKRDCEVIQIPSGEKVLLEKGTPVFVTQALGGTYTVSYSRGLARIPSKDQDALGVVTEETSEAENQSTSGEVNEEKVWEQLKTVYDPEIPVNIVDLGLVYSMEVKKEEKGHRVEVKMTLTAPGCGMGPTIAADAREKVLLVPGVVEADVQLVWDPPWNPGMISEAGRMKLGMV
ncbi:MAG: putative Fe-S cluster assembly protein SufT [Verrucomicrobiae bacterium]|nr:putative Fe-S cluster assembly protein SufT [Verrucomicrobiae bacterium]